MSIRRKLYLSFLTMVIVPFIAICALMLIIINSVGTEDVRKYFNEEGNIGYHQAFVAGGLDYVLRNDPGQIEQSDYLEEIDVEMAKVNAGFVLIRNGQVQAVSSYLEKIAGNENWLQLEDSAPAKVTYNQYRFQTNSLTFKYADGTDGRALLLLRFDVIPMYWKPIFLLGVMIIIGLTSVLLSYYVSRSIISPIQSLKKAALYMKEGDLTHPVEVTATGEVGQLSVAFEEMRVRLKQSIDQSLQYEENRKMLLSHISHDLKTPISAIKGYVEGIIDGIANTEEKRERYMSTIYRKATDMDMLIDELFLFSKLDLHKVAFDFKVIDLRRYVHHFMEEQMFEMDKEGIELIIPEWDASQAPLLVAADSEKISRVLTNILNNSVKYMGQHHNAEGNTITITIEKQEQQAIVILEDTGPGIDEMDLPYIFDGFYRAEQSRNSETGGSGLGLAIVKQIIEGHGGRVWAENGEKAGLRFFLTLPVSVPVPSKMVSEHEKDTYN